MDAPQSGELGWTARRGNACADLQPMLDRLFLPFETLMSDAVLAEGACEVLDVGCGTGAVSLAVARRLAGRGHCSGIDIAGNLLRVARLRAAAEGMDNVRFVSGDAQRHAFQGSFDAMVSRFGVMFFDDAARAFANIRGAIRAGGTMTCAVWRRREDNPFMTAAERAAAPLLGWADRIDPRAPGQFAFADADHVAWILYDAGWGGIDITPIDIPCRLTEADLALYARRMGPVGVALPGLDADLRRKVEAALDNAFARFVTGGVACFDAACWMVRAQSD